jgi:TRAP-type mannitol/chloroaromatic compound transport system permease large subunit
MELFFLAVLVIIMATALGSGFPVAFALPGAAIISIGLAAGTGWIFTGETDSFFHSGGPSQWLSAGVTNLRGVYWEVERDTLIAIPLFIFMGIMLQRSKIAEDLLVTMARLFGPVPGGLGISVVFVGALLAATTGIVGATVVAMGLISLPAMLRNNYSAPLATGTIAASGTLGQIIPPSIVLIILADQLASATDQASSARKALYKDATGEISMPSIFDVASTSAGEMFLGAFIPGMILVGLYMLYILVFAIFRPKSAPAVRYSGEFDLKFWGNVVLTLVPPLALIFLVLGSIITGIATVNQAGAIGAAGALIMAGYRLTEGKRGTFYPAIAALAGLVILTYALQNYDMNIKRVENAADQTGITLGVIGTLLIVGSLVWSALRVLRIEGTLQSVMLETAKTTSLVFIILLGAAMLTAAFRAFGGEDLVRDFLNSLPGGFWSKFVIVMAVIFVLGFFLDFIEIAVVVVPIVAPILLADPSANITAVWLGVMIGLNIQTSFLTPPFGFALFYLRGVAPAIVKTVQIYKGVIPFILLQLLALGIVGSVPQLVNYLPNRASFLSETSPPPRNPHLQQCLDTFAMRQIADDGGSLFAAIDAAKTLNLSVLPKSIASDLSGSFESAEASIAALNQISSAHDEVIAASSDYRPALTSVRLIERHIRALAAERDTLKKLIGRNRDAAQADQKARLQAESDAIDTKIQALSATIPASWAKTYSSFSVLTKAETKIRATYRKQGEAAYTPARELINVLLANEDFSGLTEGLNELQNVVLNIEIEAAIERLKSFEKEVGQVAGASAVKKLLAKARRALKAKTPDRGLAMAEYLKAKAEFEDQVIWRAEGKDALLDGLDDYLAAVENTIGVRMLDRLPREHALFVAGCRSGHKDLSLNF